jgi:3-phosphoshikimate 1-carboxyvinyltransferase
MRAIITPHQFNGVFRIPASKSHTIRRLIIAALGKGETSIEYPLDSLDAKSCVNFCRCLGAEVTGQYDGKNLVKYVVKGKGPRSARYDAENKTIKVDVGNSGTTLFLGLAAASLGTRAFEFDGDEQIRRRGAGPLLEALAGLGVHVESKNNSGCAPIIVQGPWKGGRVSLPSPTSQYLSALLLAAPLAFSPAGSGPREICTEIDVPLLNERPYIEMTLSYLDRQGVQYTTNSDFSYFNIKSFTQEENGDIPAYSVINGPVPGDFSSAAFPAAAAAISGGSVTLLGLDPNDTQGDKYFFSILESMGCEVRWAAAESGKKTGAPEVTIRSTGKLRPGIFDLNATPDLLPAAAVVAAFADGDTALINAAHARIKETDRIAVMAEELAKLGIRCTENPDGLIIHGCGPAGAGASAASALNTGASPLTVDGHGDHRIVMALACAGLGIGNTGAEKNGAGSLIITGAEAAAVTYPCFLELLGAAMHGQAPYP